MQFWTKTALNVFSPVYGEKTLRQYGPASKKPLVRTRNLSKPCNLVKLSLNILEYIRYCIGFGVSLAAEHDFLTLVFYRPP